MNNKYLAMAYECLSSIGNSFELESMMGEVVMTFMQSTKALYVAYYQNAKKPIVFAGNKSYHKEIEYPKECYINELDEVIEIVLSLKNSYIRLVYKQDSEVYEIYKILCKFERKINFALSACAGVKELEELNEELDDRVRVAVRQIREQEEMLLVQSKSAVMGEMLEMIAHQWRQPITSVGMISNNILFTLIVNEDEGVDVEYIKNELNDINRQIRYLSDTIDDFRGFFRESKNKERITASELMHKSLSLMQKQLGQHSIQVDIIDNTDNRVINTYKSEFMQVILNLFHNSKDAFENIAVKNKKITIKSDILDNELIIKVLDNAGGIDKDIISKIFEPYFSTKKQKNGTGLGLYMSKIIVNKYLCGNISVKSQNQTTEFTITIPLDCQKD